MQGRGVELPLPGLPLQAPVVQLQNLLGEYWEATFDASTVQRNDATRFRATLRR